MWYMSQVYFLLDFSDVTEFDFKIIIRVPAMFRALLDLLRL